MSSTDISIFRREGVDVRALLIDGQPWLVVADVARILGYRDAANAARLLRDHQKGYSEVSTPSGMQNMLITSEQGFYRLMLRSNAANADAVQDWVTDEVLPGIRANGSYSLTPAARAIPQSFAEALREFAAEIDAHEATKAELAEVAPRAEAWDAIASAAGDYAVGDAAKMLARAGIPTGPQRLFDQLGALKWTYRGEGGKWRAYAERVERGYLTERPQFHYHPKTGERVIDQPQLRVTIKGLERLRQRLHVGALKAVSA